MAGAILGAIGAQASTGTGVVLSPAPAWTTLYGFGVASSNSQTLAGITTGITISASLTGPAALGYTQNGAAYGYTGAFTAHAGDVISWQVTNTAPGVRQTGTVTVLNVSNGSAAIGSMAYSVKDTPY